MNSSQIFKVLDIQFGLHLAMNEGIHVFNHLPDTPPIQQKPIHIFLPLFAIWNS